MCSFSLESWPNRIPKNVTNFKPFGSNFLGCLWKTDIPVNDTQTWHRWYFNSSAIERNEEDAMEEWRNKNKIEKVKLAKRKWIAKNSLLAMDTEKSLENIQHIGDHLACLGKWQTVHNAGIHQSVLIPQKNSHGIMGCPRSGPETTESLLSMSHFWRNYVLPKPHVFVLSQNGSLAVAGRSPSWLPMLPTSLAAKLGNNGCWGCYLASG